MEIKYKIWLDDSGKIFGEGPYQLLSGVLQHGSLSQAAKELNMSYSRAHGLMKKLSRKLGFSLIESHSGGVGGGETTVTAEAKDLMRRYKLFMDENKQNIDQAFNKYFPQHLPALFNVPKKLADFSFKKNELIAIVGGGGKTSLMYALAREFASSGAAVLVTTTTRIFMPEPTQVNRTLLADVENLLDMLNNIDLSGKVTAVGYGFENGKILPIDQDFLTEATKLPQIDYIIVEADGANRQPFKAPAYYEPVIPTNATYVINVTGLNALDAPFDKDHCHRPEIIVDIVGANSENIIDANMIASVILSPKGGRKGIPEGAHWLPVINKVDDQQSIAKAETIAEKLFEGGAGQVLLTSVKNGELKVISRCPEK